MATPPQPDLTPRPVAPAGQGPAPGAPSASAVPAPRPTPTPGAPPAKTGPAPAPPPRKRAPTLYAIIIIKLLKGALFVGLAITAYTLSDNDLPAEFLGLLHNLRLDPESRIWAHLARRVSQLTETQVLVAAAGLLVYSLFSFVEGIGLCFRISWAGWLAIGESAFFIPIEIDHLCRRGPSLVVFIVLGINVLVVWYLFQNRRRLFRQRH